MTFFCESCALYSDRHFCIFQRFLLPASSRHHDDRGGKHVWNFGQLLLDYTVQYARRLSCSCSWQWCYSDSRSFLLKSVYRTGTYSECPVYLDHLRSLKFIMSSWFLCYKQKCYKEIVYGIMCPLEIETFVRIFFLLLLKKVFFKWWRQNGTRRM